MKKSIDTRDIKLKDRKVYKRILGTITAFTSTSFYLTLCNLSLVMADGIEDTSKFDTFFKGVLKWAGRIGIVIAVWGGIKVAMALQSHNAEEQTRGYWQIASGLLIFLVTVSPTIFGF